MTTVRKMTLREFQALARKGEKLVTLTAYDATMARLADAAGVHLLLVGDSLGMTMLGQPNTLAVTLDQSLHHTAAVVRGTKRALVIGDMPFLSYQVNADEAVRNAGRYLKEAGADGVKLEGGRTVAPLVVRLVQTGIPVLGHVGILPQLVVADSGYHIKGRKDGEAEDLLNDALALQEAGAFAVVLEGIPEGVGRTITETLDIPTLGIGAGRYCDGQLQVIHDLLGLFEDFVPRHAKRYAQLADAIRQAVGTYAADVQAGRFPGEEQTFQ